MLAKHNVKCIPIPPKNTCSYLPPIKDAVVREHPVYTASLVNVGRYTLDKATVLYTSELKNTKDT
jgi:hypothetical protein